MSYVPAGFRSRWIVEGTLVTRGPLHVGSGEPKPVARGDLSEDVEVEVRTVATGRDGRPVLPGSSLKGVLRARLAGRLGPQHAIVEALFGKPEGRAENDTRDAGHAGRVDFHESHAPAQQLQAGAMPPPLWDPGGLVGIAASVALNRRTRTAARQKLFHAEVVPAGIAFRVRLVGHDLEPEEVAWLLWALGEFGGDDEGGRPAHPLRLGARTRNGWGEMSWRLGAVRKLEAAAVCAHVAGWLADPRRLKPVAIEDGTTAGWVAVDSASLPAVGGEGGTNGAVTLPITLRFSGSFLVKRPARPKQKGDTRTPNAEPHLDAAGRVVLPAASFRGALRAQAERILRTLAGDAGRAMEWAPDPTAKVIEELHDGSPSSLSWIGRVFGATGWASPIEVTAFASVDDTPLEDQDFVAVDRFSGGSADGAKFKFRRAWQPVLRGELRLRPDRWGDHAPWALGLLALALRDLVEGDIVFGLGAAKGYGRCRADVSPELEAFLEDPATQRSLETLRVASRAEGESITVERTHV